jgi:threonine dehydrogenase-like Zn-dependent dehydrogenase
LRALVLSGSGALALREVPRPARGGECLIAVRMAGICGTDLQMLEGYAGFNGIPGHEFVGVVQEASSPDDAAWIGKRVVGDINVGCLTCKWCLAGVKEHCDNRSVLGIRDHDGAFAEMLTLPARNLHEVPDSVSDEAAVFVEPIAAACRIFEQLTIDDRLRIAVVGDGRMGLLVAQVLCTATPHVTVLGRHEEKLGVARSLGLDARLSTAAVSDRYDVVVDVTGRPEGLKRALEIVRPRGTVVMKSTFHGEAPLESWPIVVDEVTLVGSRCGPFRPAIDLLASGAVQTAPLVSRIAPLEEFESAFADARRSLKVLFRL